MRALHDGEELGDLDASSHHGESLRALGSNQSVEVFEWLLQDLGIEESQGRARLMLGSGRHLTLHRQMLEKRQNFGTPYVTWVCMVAKGEKPVDPVLIGMFRADGIASATNFRDQLLSPYRLWVATRHRASAMPLR
jgi:hypothetical protein